MDGLKTSLLPYQQVGLDWMINRESSEHVIEGEHIPYGGIISDDVGLGKTLLAISIILENPTKTLIILPKSLVLQWYEQISKFTDMNVQIITKDVTTFENNVYLISQSQLNKRNTVVGDTPVHAVEWGRIIIDEAHSLRNNKSKMYQACSLLKSKIRWALTATPVMNRMTDFVHIMQWVGVSQFLCQCQKDTITKLLILRRTKADVFIEGDDNIECNIQVKYIPFDNVNERALYLEVFKQERQIIKKSNKNITDLLEHLLRVRQLCIHPQLYLDGMTKKKQTSYGNWEHGVTKVKALLENINLHEDKTEKVLVFCQFVNEINMYMKVLERNQYKCERLDGTMKAHERNDAVIRFQNDKDITIFLIQINTGGQGINLQNANHIYIMSPNWNPAIEHQAIGRAYRNGQKKNVYVTKFCISSGSDKYPYIEENIIKLQEHKKRIIANILDDNRLINDGVLHNKGPLANVCKSEIEKLFNI